MSFIKKLMTDIILSAALIILLLTFISKADNDFHLVELNSVYTDYMHFTWAKEPFMSDRGLTPTNRLDLHTDLDLFNGIGFVNTMVHSETDLTQYRLVGLNYRAGIHIATWADIYFEHFSQHLLDINTYNANTYDAVGVRFYLYRKDEKK